MCAVCELHTQRIRNARLRLQFIKRENRELTFFNISIQCAAAQHAKAHHRRPSFKQWEEGKKGGGAGAGAGAGERRQNSWKLLGSCSVGSSFEGEIEMR